jgi:L-cysteine desulfidase
MSKENAQTKPVKHSTSIQRDAVTFDMKKAVPQSLKELYTDTDWMVSLLKEEVKPATGCTEPVAVALAAAKAVEILEMPFSRLIVGISPNIYKNGFAVMLPGIQEAGLDLAAALGAARGQASQGLDVLKQLSDEEVISGRRYLFEKRIEIELIPTDEKVLITARAISIDGHHETLICIRGRHDRFEFIERDALRIFEAEASSEAHGVSHYETFYKMRVSELVDLVANVNPEPLAFLLDGIRMNRVVSDLGMTSSLGLGAGYAMSQRTKKLGQLPDLCRLAMRMTAGASDARMAGVDLPVMSSNGSGNNGITTLMPLAAYFEIHEVTRHEQIRAIALSHLLNSYIKAEIGRLSALCSCGIAAATGASAAIAWLDTRDGNVVEAAIVNMIANLSGMVCDGAKYGCSLKLATAAATAVEMAMLAAGGIRVPAGNGLIGTTVEKTIANLGLFSREGMQLADQVILGIQKASMKCSDPANGGKSTSAHEPSIVQIKKH